MYKSKHAPPAGAVADVNQITGDLPIYRPNDKGMTVVRVLPAFDDQGNELPIADWAVGRPDTSEGLGNQHFEVRAVSLWKGTSHLFSVSSIDPDSGQIERSPASHACERLQPLFEEAVAAKKAGCDVDPLFGNLGKYENAWINEQDMHFVQALLVQHGGRAKTDPITGRSPHVALQLNWSSVKDLRGKLFTTRQWSGDGNTGASEHDNNLGDYASCAGGYLFGVQVDLSDPKQKRYAVGLIGKEPAPIDPEYARSLWIPWDRLCPPPTHGETVAALSRLLRFDVFGYALTGTPFEHMLSAEAVAAGRKLRVVLAPPGAKKYAQPSGQDGGFQAPPAGGFQAPRGGFQAPAAGGFQAPPAGGFQVPRGGFQAPAATGFQVPRGGFQAPAATGFQAPAGAVDDDDDEQPFAGPAAGGPAVPSFPSPSADPDEIPHMPPPRQREQQTPAQQPQGFYQPPAGGGGRPPASPLGPGAPVPPAPPSPAQLAGAASAGAAQAAPPRLIV